MNAKISRLITGLCPFFTVSLLLFSCCFANPQMNEIELKGLLTPYENKLGQSTQIIIVGERIGLSSSRYFVYTVEKKHDHWKWVSGPIEATIGKNGFALPGEKREGDGRTPSGIFSLKRTFGYDKTVKTKMPYRQATEEDLWVDDPNAPDYNQWVKQAETGAASYEKMKREDLQYKYGIVIEYNTDPVIKGHGSAIFFHVWKGKDSPTAGCVAVSEEDIIKILGWLDPNAFPLIIMGIKN
jgi:L,D-peptidoglycan transpeptidase YkuD (ErfK/YbiS/YcfS/YnhG family)